MAEIVVTVVGLKELEAKLTRFPNIIRDTRRRAMTGAVDHIQRKVQKYPPQQPSIRRLTAGQLQKLGRGGYKRTMRLSTSWTTKVDPAGTQGIIGTNVKSPSGKPYAPYVQGSRNTSPGQSRVMQRKGWKSVDDVVKEEQKTVEEIFAREIRAMVKELS